LFVRFKDGLSGRVRFREEDLTGALAPLRDARLFQQVFIEDGAVAWPGEIDLAPDARYEDIAAQTLSVGRARVHSAIKRAALRLSPISMNLTLMGRILLVKKLLSGNAVSQPEASTRLDAGVVLHCIDPTDSSAT
jgi:hypothetical protein